MPIVTTATSVVPARCRFDDGLVVLRLQHVTLQTETIPSPSRTAFAENVQWFGEEVAAKLRGS